MHTCTYIHTYIHTHTCIHTYIHKCIQVSSDDAFLIFERQVGSTTHRFRSMFEQCGGQKIPRQYTEIVTDKVYIAVFVLLCVHLARSHVVLCVCLFCVHACDM